MPPVHIVPAAKKTTRTAPEPSAPDSPDIFALIGKAENIESASSALAAMAHPMRLKILCMLSSGELPVQELNDALGTTHSNISQHLKVLKDEGIVDNRKDAQKVFYRITDERILKMIGMTREIFCGI
jgi:DNA-binding transcriptional ArsR family regulator